VLRKVVIPCKLRHRAPMPGMQRFWLALADLVLLIHAAFIALVVVGLVVVWLGRFWGCGFVRNFWFRATHLAAIMLVVAKSLVDWVCPLTTWEDHLRLLAGAQRRCAGSFIQHWLHRLIFFDFDQGVFTCAYVAFFLAVALSFLRIPPRWPGRNRT
jgi:hypothetical protein